MSKHHTNPAGIFMNATKRHIKTAFDYSKYGVIVITEAANSEIMSYEKALKSLDAGQYDNDLLLGFELVLALSHGWKAGFYEPTSEQRLMLWRWIVSASFVQEQIDRNGTREVDNDRGGTDTAAIYVNGKAAITIYPLAERMMLVTHVEGIAFEQFGSEEGADMAVRMYMDFINVQSEKGNRLSEKGREGLSILHDELIKSVKAGEFGAIPVIH
ncbi:conserved hypothetical protein [Xenorhabdus bovienii str. oregonense]|uniref:Uncharacterized protein n=1 Tax=Xenorhabdus bovienii str. oregonense TaxID=1398202 RepID=A0A077PE27_XENBV|nr:hypothetical protein [Xenorhabdus bovienii]CDH07981.1 conserved hypothetical protein [Xenorhabdus bovienii str. oregonense]